MPSETRHILGVILQYWPAPQRKPAMPPQRLAAEASPLDASTSTLAAAASQIERDCSFMTVAPAGRSRARSGNLQLIVVEAAGLPFLRLNISRQPPYIAPYANAA
jgi:hypothetical protein